jgi:uncharacterized protein YeaO (DUF488 family)
VSDKKYQIKRVYEAPSAADGLRMLVDRLWPRGVSKASGRIDLWAKELAPSDKLRREFHAKPERWAEFVKAYAKELETPESQAAAAALRSQKKSTITLLYAAKDEERNNAVVLLDWLRRG